MLYEFTGTGGKILYINPASVEAVLLSGQIVLIRTVNASYYVRGTLDEVSARLSGTVKSPSIGLQHITEGDAV